MPFRSARNRFVLEIRLAYVVDVDMRKVVSTIVPDALLLQVKQASPRALLMLWEESSIGFLLVASMMSAKLRVTVVPTLVLCLEN